MIDTFLAPPPTSSPDDRELLRRVSAEFHEMPGLQLTLPQAARLFSLEPVYCAVLLESLVRRGELAKDGPLFHIAERMPACTPAGRAASSRSSPNPFDSDVDVRVTRSSPAWNRSR